MKNKWNWTVVSNITLLIQIIALPSIVVSTFLSYFQLEEYLSKPDLHFEFFNSESISFTLTNNSETAAELPRYWFTLFDLDAQKSVLIPSKEFSYLHSNGRVGPRGDLKNYLTIQHRYTGMAGIVCKNCDAPKVYWIFFIHGIQNSGWYINIDQEKAAATATELIGKIDAEELFDAVLPKSQRIQF